MKIIGAISIFLMVAFSGPVFRAANRTDAGCMMYNFGDREFCDRIKAINEKYDRIEAEQKQASK